MEVWIIQEYDCESGHVVRILSSQEKAEKAILEERDRLVSEWKRMVDFCKEEHSSSEMYERMIKNLSSNDWREWHNYPHDNFSVKVWKVE